MLAQALPMLLANGLPQSAVLLVLAPVQKILLVIVTNYPGQAA
jgi:hypothetical protein